MNLNLLSRPPFSSTSRRMVVRRGASFAMLLALVLMLVVMPSVARTQPSVARVLPLVADMTVVHASPTQPAQSTLNFWWGATDRPRWTPTDLLLQKMAPDLLKSADVSQISVIFKTPNLTDSNAAALGRTFGAQQVLVGRMLKTVYAEKPLGQPLESLEFVGTLLDISGPTVKVVRQFSNKRTFLSPTPEKEEAMKVEILEPVVAAFSTPTTMPPPDLFSQRLSDDLTVALQKMDNLTDLQQVIHALEQRIDIKSADIDWVSDNVITLKLKPVIGHGKNLHPDEILQFLANSRFDSFLLDVKNGPDDRIIVATRVRTTPNP